MARQVPPRDPNYQVDGLPPSIKGKVTELAEASMNYAFVGAADPLDMPGIEEAFHIARHDLERTVKTLLDREKPKGQVIAGLTRAQADALISAATAILAGQEGEGDAQGINFAILSRAVGALSKAL